jgi:hypothetical protein
MTKYLLATLGLAAILMASTALANDVSVPNDRNALPTNRLAPGPVVPLNTHVAEALPPMGSARADCLVALPSSISNAFAKGELDADSQRILDAEHLWGRNPLEQALKGEFQGQIGVSEYKIGDQSYEDIPFSLLNRDALSKILFTDPRSQTSQLFIPSIAGLNVPRLIVHVVPPTFEATSPLIIAPALFAQWIELDPTYTIALKPRPSC